MSVLTGPEITRLVEKTRRIEQGEMLPILPTIEIEPFDPELAGPNSYDVHLSPELRVYALRSVAVVHPELFGAFMVDDEQSYFKLADGVDAHADNPTISFTIPPTGFWMQPGVPCDSIRLAVLTASPHRS